MDQKCDRSLLIHCLTTIQQTALSRDPNITHSNEFVPYSRLSFSTSKRSILNSFVRSIIFLLVQKSPIADGYDIVSCRPQNQDIFDHACKSVIIIFTGLYQSFIDIIEIPVDCSLPFKVTKESVDNAIKNGILFEFTYGSTLFDRTSRRYLLSSSYNIVKFARGNHILIGRSLMD